MQHKKKTIVVVNIEQRNTHEYISIISYVIFMSNTWPHVPRVHFRVEDICTNLCLLKIKIHVNSWLEGAGHILYM